MNRSSQRGFVFVLLVVLLFFHCEFLVHYLVLLQCTWPQLNLGAAEYRSAVDHNPLRVILIADTHLLGSREGHWFDKLRREWQMERTFQSAMTLFSPDVVFVLGDLFDEGKWSNDVEFHYYKQRFLRMFAHSDKTEMQVVVGNHDIGFHYMVSDERRKHFSSSFDAPSIRMLRMRNNIFVLVNSMAMEGDNCDMCREAQLQLTEIYNQLQCSKGKKPQDECLMEPFKYTKPILLQHFPLFRRSNKNCSGVDSGPPEEHGRHMNPKKDMLSQDATKKLLDAIAPRLVISGHTHYACETWHHGNIPEITVSSFSWRNNPYPSFIMLHVSNDNYAMEKCHMVHEGTVINMYIFGTIFIVLWLLYFKIVSLYWRVRNFTQTSKLL